MSKTPIVDRIVTTWVPIGISAACIAAWVLLAGCSTPRILEVGPNGGECHNGNGLSMLCADGVTCCRPGTECGAVSGQCIVVDERPAPFAGAKLDAGVDR